MNIEWLFVFSFFFLLFFFFPWNEWYKAHVFLLESCFVASSHVTYGGSIAAHGPRSLGLVVQGSVNGAQLWPCDDDDDDDWLTGTVWGRGWLTLWLCPHQSIGARLLWMFSCLRGGRKHVVLFANWIKFVPDRSPGLHPVSPDLNRRHSQETITPTMTWRVKYHRQLSIQNSSLRKWCVEQHLLPSSICLFFLFMASFGQRNRTRITIFKKGNHTHSIISALTRQMIYISAKL